MKERPIIFSAPMVLAILEGRKTMTRRVVRDIKQPGDTAHRMSAAAEKACLNDDGEWVFEDLDETSRYVVDCPYGKPGDRLWVRETCRAMRMPSEIWGVRYLADLDWRPNAKAEALAWYGRREGAHMPPKNVPAIHMPRWASRITLEITAVRVERLNDITVADAVAEGALVKREVDQFARVHAISMFSAIWQGIHGPGSWDANPWVWVIEFKRVFS